MIDETRIRDWLAAYRHAWSTDDPARGRGAVHRGRALLHGAVPPAARGRPARHDYWIGEHEGEIPWSFEYQVLAQEGDLFVVRAVTTYPEGTSDAEGPETFHNLWLVTLDDDGRASEFVEYFMLVE